MGHVGRRKFLFAAGAALAARVSRAQQPQRLRKIGFLGINDPTHPAAQFVRRSLADSLRRLGYEEGKNLLVERRYAEGRLERFPALADELVRLDVEIIVAMGNVAAHAAKRATGTIPIVIAAGQPVEDGLIDSYARPGENVTGIDWSPALEITEKNYQLLKDAVPAASRAARIWYPANFHRYGEEHLRRIHATTGLTVVSASMTRAEQMQEVLERVAASQAEVLYVSGFEFFFPHYPAIAAFAARRKLVSISDSGNYTGAGGLLHYSPDAPSLLDRTARHIDRILRGAKPADIPVEHPTKYELVLNGKTAEAMGVRLPRAFLAQVSRVIE
jgi:putative ABC transport system substrate-binding protein